MLLKMSKVLIINFVSSVRKVELGPCCVTWVI